MLVNADEKAARQVERTLGRRPETRHLALIPWPASLRRWGTSGSSRTATAGGPSAGRPPCPSSWSTSTTADIATVDYRAADALGGRFYLGYEPRIYFEEPGAGDPGRHPRRGGGLRRAGRRRRRTPTSTPTDVQRLLASPEGAPPADESVELTVEKLLELAGLPLPEWPADDDAPAG